MENYIFEGITLDDDGTIHNGTFVDDIGHGTGVVYNFLHYHSADNVKCFMVKIFDRANEVKEWKIIYALKYIHDHFPCDIVNISCGVAQCINIQAMFSVCEDLYKKGAVIVAGYDNDGCLSYPASFKHVIGVDISTSCFKKTDLQFVESELINLRGYGYQQKLPALGDNYRYQAGSSFVVPYVSALIANIMESGITDFDGILSTIKKASEKKIYPQIAVKNKFDLKINNAVLFPFNKEMHALISFADILSFKIIDVYDTKFSGNVGKNTKDNIKIYDSSTNYIIKNIDNIEWNNFDTLIMGHISKIELVMGKKIKEKLIEECISHGKNLYFYDVEGVSSELISQMKGQIKFFSPEVNKQHVASDQFGKLYNIARPVLAFFGTSPKQGKMTAQILTKRYLEKLEYKVGALGTEPNALLLGFNEIYNMGFSSSIRVSGDYAIIYINGLLHNIELEEPDIIIVGSQSQTICLNTGNLGFYPHTQYELLLAAQPDAYVINVNIFDDDEYVQRTICFLESASQGVVLCLVLFPVKYDNYQGHLVGKGTSYSKEVIEQKIKHLEELTGKPVFLLDEKVGEKIGNVCIQYFGESEIQ